MESLIEMKEMRNICEFCKESDCFSTNLVLYIILLGGTGVYLGRAFILLLLLFFLMVGVVQWSVIKMTETIDWKKDMKMK